MFSDLVRDACRLCGQVQPSCPPPSVPLRFSPAHARIRPSCPPSCPASPRSARELPRPFSQETHLLPEAPPNTCLQVRVALSSQPPRVHGPAWTPPSGAPPLSSFCPHPHPAGHQVVAIQSVLISSLSCPDQGSESSPDQALLLQSFLCSPARSFLK